MDDLGKPQRGFHTLNPVAENLLELSDFFHHLVYVSQCERTCWYLSGYILFKISQKYLSIWREENYLYLLSSQKWMLAIISTIDIAISCLLILSSDTVPMKPQWSSLILEDIDPKYCRYIVEMTLWASNSTSGWRFHKLFFYIFGGDYGKHRAYEIQTRCRRNWQTSWSGFDNFTHLCWHRAL